MIRICGGGRLGNALFQNCLANIFAKKFDLKIINFKQVNKLNFLNFIPYINGTIVKKNFTDVTNRNFLRILNQSKINTGLKLTGFYQKKEFVTKYKKEILENFDLNYDDNYKQDLFVHVRLGDLVDKNYQKRIPPFQYYSSVIENVKFKTGYIASDSLTHPLITKLVKTYNLIPYNNTPPETINFGKNFNNLVLSRGTFSWWIGFLSQAEKIFYPTGGPEWHGDIFVFNNWIPVNMYQPLNSIKSLPINTNWTPLNISQNHNSKGPFLNNTIWTPLNIR